VIQDVGLFPHMTVSANVSVVPRLERWPAARVRERSEALLELVGLSPATYGPRWPRELSGGERQRVGVARALALDPPLLLMDEPLGALDPLTRAEMQREIRRIQQQLRKTVIFVTHDLGEAFALGDRLGLLESGHLIACDAPAAVAASGDPRVRAFLGAATPPAAVLDWLRSAAAPSR
jgi:osmoprotectant transport system ATP-binding protein